MSSEELIQRGLQKKGITVGDYEFFPLHSTTVNQYKKSKIIPAIDYGAYGIRKPDGLLIRRLGTSEPQVVAVLEYKLPSDFQTDKQKKDAIEQCNDLCQVLKARIGIVTDGIVTFWINPNHPDSKNDYNDRTSGITRSYSFILNNDKQKLQKKFYIKEADCERSEDFDDDTKEVYETIERILLETDDKNSLLKPREDIDPTPLARSVWQSIYISTKDNPTACLYNVIEIFIFKFLSDLGVLEGIHSFSYLASMYDTEDNKTVLRHYALTCRPKIRSLFKEGEDHTTIINGTIFVNKDGGPVLSQATLFKETIKKYEKFGDLRSIKKEFKTKLFETFLKQSKDKSKLGQFFTPRKVVKAIVEMADIDKARLICDPFCGVGGFVLEPLQISQTLKNKFIPRNGQISSDVKLLGYDTGREDNDEQKRTIILAKANMLIYLSDILEKYPQANDAFSTLINETFHFLSNSNLGTLEVQYEHEDEKPDLIITNPPYITSGVQTIRKEIEEEGLAHLYKNSGKGVEGLCLKWIITNLKKSGSAFVILPEGIFNVFANRALRDDIKNYCYINCIISLPEKTFFNTPKKTYILGITKKLNPEDKQTFPVFTYLASSIGEQLNINRFEVEENDLDKAKNLFNQFKGSPTTFKTDDPRCKLQPIEKFEQEKYWIIDKWWTKEEKMELGIVEEQSVLTKDELQEMVEKMQHQLSKLTALVDFNHEPGKTESVLITDLFDPHKGTAKYTKKYMHEHPGIYPVYSSQTTESGKSGEIDSFDYEKECFTWTTDGVYAGTVFYRNEKFSITTHCGILDLKPQYADTISFRYLYFILNKVLPLNTLGEGANKRLGVERMHEIYIDIPVTADGTFDFKKQEEIADRYARIEETKQEMEKSYKQLITSKIDVLEVE